MSRSIRYYSTRDGVRNSPCSFDDLLLGATAPDGGLYLPAQFPPLPTEIFSQPCSYQEVVHTVLAPYAAGSVLEAELPDLIHQSYAGFRHPEVAPLCQLEAGLWFLELFHGPTFAFKDLAMQCLGQLIPALLGKNNKEITILVATSGDTGSAALAAFADKPQVRCLVLYPAGRISEVQRKQMTALAANNTKAVAVAGTFDDCQALVKQAFARADWCKAYGLTAVNSINWVRIVIQAAYYVWATQALREAAGKVSFVVPSGNFGNAYAGWVAKQMGAPIESLGIATNRNDILARFLATGALTSQAVCPTVAPSMDIQVPSNFERLLFALFQGDAERTAQSLRDFAQTGQLALDDELLAAAQTDFWGRAVSEAEILREIAKTQQECGVLIDPHSAVGLVAARAYLAEQKSEASLVALGCAHPAKFPTAVEKATGTPPDTPAPLAEILSAPEQIYELENDLTALGALLEETQ